MLAKPVAHGENRVDAGLQPIAAPRKFVPEVRPYVVPVPAARWALRPFPCSPDGGFFPVLSDSPRCSPLSACRGVSWARAFSGPLDRRKPFVEVVGGAHRTEHGIFVSGGIMASRMIHAPEQSCCSA